MSSIKIGMLPTFDGLVAFGANNWYEISQQEIVPDDRTSRLHYFVKG